MQNPFVQRLKFLYKLRDADIHILEGLCNNPRDIAPKSYIFCGVAGASRVPVIMSGWAARHQILRNGGRQITRLMLPGDAYYLHASSEMSSQEEVVTLGPYKIAYIPISSIERAMETSLPIARAIRNYESIENSIISSMVVNLGRRDALERLAYLLCELHFRLGLIDGCVDDNQFAFPLTQDDLADVLGLTPVHVNRKLQQLRQNDIINLRSRKMQILDLPQLRQIAGFNASYLAHGPQINERRLVPG